MSSPRIGSTAHSRMRSRQARKLWASKAFRRKQRKSRRKAWSNPEVRKKLRNARLRDWKNPEYRKSISIGRSKQLKRQWKQKKYRVSMAKVCKKGGRVAIGKYHKRFKSDCVFRKNQIVKKKKTGSKTLGRLWKTKKFVDRFRETHGITPSKVQTSVFRSLCARGVSGMNMEVSVERYSIDIAFKKKKLAFELDEPYWHKKSVDRRKDVALRRNGWKVIRLPAKKDSVFKILSFLGKKQCWF